MKIKCTYIGFNKHKYLISSSFYIAKNAKPDRIKEYIRGIYTLRDAIAKQNIWTWRLYYDDSVTEDILNFDSLLSTDKIELVKFECSKFKQDIGHTEHFGTIIRFLPIFYNDFKIVKVLDVDVADDILINTLRWLKKFLKSKSKIMIPSSYRKVNQSHVYFDNEVILFPSNAQLMVKGNIDKHIFESFFRNYDKSTLKYRKYRYDGDRLYFKLTYENNKELINNTPMHTELQKDFMICPYGIDEFFLNNHVLLNINRNTIVFTKLSKLTDMNNYLSRYTIWKKLYFNKNDIMNRKFEKKFIPGMFKDINSEELLKYISLIGTYDPSKKLLYRRIDKNLKEILKIKNNYEKYILTDNKFFSNTERAHIYIHLNYNIEENKVIICPIEKIIFI